MKDLPPAYQVQAYKQVMEQQARRREIPSSADAEKPKENKYHNKPTERVTASGKVIHFQSRKEARRYDELMIMLQTGKIRDLRLQVDFTLQEAYTDSEGRRVRAIRYKADFAYKARDQEQEKEAAEMGFPRTSWRQVVEDVKSRSTKTKTYAMKRKMMKDRFNIDIQEV